MCLFFVDYFGEGGSMFVLFVFIFAVAVVVFLFYIGVLCVCFVMILSGFMEQYIRNRPIY